MNDFGTKIALLINLIFIAGLIWKIAQWEAILEVKIEQNASDITEGLKSVRKEVRQKDYFLNIQIQTISRFLEDTTSYRHPSMGNLDDNK